MSFWEYFQDWKIGGVLTALILPLLFLHMTESNAITTSGWTLPKVNGLYSRVRLFVKNKRSSPSSAGGGIQQTSVGENGRSQINNLTPDLVAEIPLSYLGQIERYKACFPSTSVLKNVQSLKVVSEEAKDSCQLITISSYSNENERELLSHLLEIVTKYLFVQHAANMIMFYTPELNFMGSYSSLSEIAQKCNVLNTESKQAIKSIFLQATESQKKCLPSPTEVEVNLRFPSASNSVNKETISLGTMWGKLKYALFDYWTTDLVKFLKNGGTPTTGKKISVKWDILYDLGATEIHDCSLNAFYKGLKRFSLNFSDLANCSLIP